VAASTGNLTLEAEQTVDGIALVDGDRVFAKDQTDTTEIGIYIVSTGTWTRAPDWDGTIDVGEGTMIPVSRGPTNGDTYWKITNTGTITVGTTAITLQATTVLSSAILNDGSVKMIADFSPNATDTYDLGTAALKWEDLHLNGAATVGGSVHLDDGILFLDKGADVASAGALTLGSDGNYFDITGTTTITSIATKGIGTIVHLHFDGALTLTHDAADLVLPGAADITTAAGDEATFIEYATGDWRCINYQKAIGPPTSLFTEESDHHRVGYHQFYTGNTVRSDNLATSVTEITWESYGPTGSGATNIWTDLDILPTNATAVLVCIEAAIQNDGVGDGSLEVYARKTGTTQGTQAKVIYLGTDNTNTEVDASAQTVAVPLDANQRFDVYWNEVNSSSTTITIYYRGFISD
jgi:hypothetical protein